MKRNVVLKCRENNPPPVQRRPGDSNQKAQDPDTHLKRGKGNPAEPYEQV
jgi:hypothetical protein